MIHIQPLTPADINEIIVIEQNAHSFPWTIGILKNNFGEKYDNLALYDDKNIIGFLICQCVLDEASLFNIAIAPYMQGKGLGKYLLQQLIERLKERKMSILWLEVRESNTIAIQLYQQMGFNYVDKRKNYYPTKEGKREDAIIMALYLS